MFTPVSHLLIDTADIKRLQPVNRGSGRFVNEYTTIATGIPFRVAAASGKERTLGEQLQSDVTHTGHCNPDVDIAKDDHVVLHSGNPFRDARTYRVVIVHDPSISYFRRVELQVYEVGKNV
jgi:hypothetical protein